MVTWVKDHDVTDDEFAEVVYDRGALSTVEQYFSDALLGDASDEIHEGRFEVWLRKEQRDDFYVKMLNHGWARACFGFMLMVHMPDQIEEVRRLIELAKDEKAGFGKEF